MLTRLNPDASEDLLAWDFEPHLQCNQAKNGLMADHVEFAEAVTVSESARHFPENCKNDLGELTRSEGRG